ncbi:MAG: hypothetical protein HY784_03715 [Chloroflexi bacterium]|nr:hypothetical protein [Chloroflexota bacterium]
MDADNNLSTISQVATDEAIGEFWDTHDFTDFDTDAPDVKFDITCAVPVEVDLFHAIEQQAQRRGVQLETLVNLWLQEKLAEQTRPLTPRPA